jgi:hypothetical protein
VATALEPGKNEDAQQVAQMQAVCCGIEAAIHAKWRASRRSSSTQGSFVRACV